MISELHQDRSRAATKDFFHYQLNLLIMSMICPKSCENAHHDLRFAFVSNQQSKSPNFSIYDINEENEEQLISKFRKLERENVLARLLEKWLK